MDNELSISSTLTHYRIIEKLGAGGMGEVYLAQDTKLDRKVAIKLLPLDSVPDDNARRRLIREARASASLDHPNICTVHEVSEDDDRCFIVMQFIEGETLAARIAQKRLNLAESLKAAMQMVDALVAAHEKGIIHRDLKPQNIMLTESNRIKILDFGLAKIVDDQGGLDAEAETRSLLTQAGVIIGTVPYMSPEQVKGERLDTRTDIFSFGTVLHEMLTGRQPFAAKTGAETMSAILTSEPPLLASPVPATLARIVQMCLEKDRERRYQTAADVARDLNTVSLDDIGDQELATRPMPQSKTAEESRRPVPTRWAAVALVVGLALVASIYAFYSRVKSPTSASANASVETQAYDDYVRGHVLVSSENREDNEAAINLLEKATSANPNLARAWADLARAYNRKAYFYAPDTEKKQLNINAEVAVEKALKLDPKLAEAHAARGVILWTHAKRFPHDQAIQSFKRALELDPNLGEAHHQLGLVYFHIGLFDKAWVEIEQALKIDPGNTLARFRFGNINIYRGRYEEALAVFKSTPRDANPALVDRNLASAFFQLGRYEEASAVVEDYIKNYPTDEGGSVTSVKAMLLARAGNQPEAEVTIQRAIEIGKGFGHFHHTAYNIGSAYALMNQPEKAVEWLQVAADDGFPCYPLFETDANLNSLRKDERFIALVNKLKKQFEQYQATL